MSRRILPAKDENITVVVGWDNPLQTYFAQVAHNDVPDDNDDDDEGDPVILWIGTNFGEVSDPSRLPGPLAPYADLTQEHLARLRADRAAQGSRGPTPAQLANSALLRRT